MLDKRYWLKQAQALKEGGQARVPHVCGPGKVMLVTHKAHRWDAWCHRCGEVGIEDKPAESLADRIARLKRAQEVEAAMVKTVNLPGPAVFDVETWPEEGRVWLYKAGCGRPEIEELGVYWHPPSNRIVLPVFERGRLTYWQARSIDGRQPKYRNPEVDRQSLVAKFGKGETLVLTEDILSAYRVSAVTEAWSLMGTKLTDIILNQIIVRGGRVAVMLDPDWNYPAGERPGVIAGIKIVRRLRSVGIDAERIVMRADPKLLSKREITKLLGAQ